MPSNGAAAGLRRHAEVPGRSALAGPHPLLRVLSRRQTVPASSRGSCTCSRPGLRSRARREREGAPMQNLLRVLLLLLTFLAPAPAFAAAVGPAPVASPPATVKFFNRDIVTLRASYYGVLPADRAAQAANRIREAVARSGPGAVKMVTTAEGLNVTIDGVYVFRILDGDLDAEDGQTFDEARAVVGKRLDEAIEAAHSSIRGGELAWALVLTLAAAAAFCLAVWLLAHGRRWLRQRLDTYLTRRIRIWEEERTTLARVIRTFGHFVFLGIVLVIAEECLRFVFRLFPYTRPWSEKLTGYAVVIAEQVAGAAVEAAPDLVMVALIAALAQFASKILAATAHGIA